MPRRDRALAATRIVGVVVTLMTLSAQASTPFRVFLQDDRYGSRVAPLLLLSRADVREELRLSARQSDASSHAAAQSYLKAKELSGKRGTEFIEARKAIDESSNRWIEANLSIEQQTRLVQIDLQWEGLSALVSRPVVVETLALTEDQRKTISATIDAFNAIRERKTPSAEEKKTTIDKVLGVLNPTQSKRWEAMLGRPFSPKFTQAEAPAEASSR
jgi:hypothetical protein